VLHDSVCLASGYHVFASRRAPPHVPDRLQNVHKAARASNCLVRAGPLPTRFAQDQLRQRSGHHGEPEKTSAPNLSTRITPHCVRSDRQNLKNLNPSSCASRNVSGYLQKELKARFLRRKEIDPPSVDNYIIYIVPTDPSMSNSESLRGGTTPLSVCCSGTLPLAASPSKWKCSGYLRTAHCAAAIRP